MKRDTIDDDDELASNNNAKGRLKKLRKVCERGEVWNAKRLAECRAVGIAVRPTVRLVPPLAVPGARIPTMRDVARIVWRVLGREAPQYKAPGTHVEAKREWPPWLIVGNPEAVERVAVVFCDSCQGIKLRVFEPRATKRRALDVLQHQSAPWANPAGTVVVPRPTANVFGLDCEMVQTTNGTELARCSIVDKSTRLDVYCLPEGEVVDYCTKYSGITAETLRDVETRLGDVQRMVREVVGKNDLLVGHSLDNDLRVLGMTHDNVADTALLYKHPKEGYKKSLKSLAKEFLGRTIQTGEHDSVQDARAALDLYWLKVANPILGSKPRKPPLVDAVRDLGKKVASTRGEREDWDLLVTTDKRGVEEQVPDNALIVAIAQPDVSSLELLEAQKKACGKGVAVWTKDLENQRIKALEACIYVAAVRQGPRSQAVVLYPAGG
ncbi:hypothetical protein CTAYLR_009200 [Chrysophaeum taylorii]|uniref:Exonuclease domain-containing protein n=1 Tax=Chrysophaeum taylorii TaxID=2483200 RepID=A0AAD7XQR4_9STRA|nr:hypothetical protein CTAYLR_009200 [Chrysophaeum taylorii]